MSLANELVEAVSAWPEVEAITLGGSRATGDNDEKSDYDVYVYVTAPVSAERRRRLLRNYCSHMEIDNDFWETEDDCTLNDGTNIDVLYRDLDQFAANVADVVERFQASNGYTTCMWHNMLTSKVLFDRDGQYAATRQRFDVPFPEELRRNIIIAICVCLPATCRRTTHRSARPRAEATKSRSTIAWPRSWNRISMCYSR